MNRSGRRAATDDPHRVLETRFRPRPAALQRAGERFDREVVQARAEFVTAKLASARSGIDAPAVALLVEPTSDRKGGCATCHAVLDPKYVYGCARPTSCSNAACSTPRIPHLPRCSDFLWSVRCNIHFFSGRRRALRSLQREIAIRLGYTSHPAWQDVERFMKHYSWSPRTSATSPRSCAQAGGSSSQTSTGAEPHDVAAAPSTRRVPDSDDFHRHHNRTTSPRPTSSRRPGQPDPDLPARAEEQSGVPPRRHGTVTRSLKSSTRSCATIPKPNRLFMEILTSNDREPCCGHERDRRARPLIRAFGKIVSMMQFNMYHHYTVASTCALRRPICRD